MYVSCFEFEDNVRKPYFSLSIFFFTKRLRGLGGECKKFADTKTWFVTLSIILFLFFYRWRFHLLLPSLFHCLQHSSGNNTNNYFWLWGVVGSVADPDPVGFGLFGSPGSGSEKIPEPNPDPLSTKDPCNYNFLVI